MYTNYNSYYLDIYVCVCAYVCVCVFNKKK